MVGSFMAEQIKWRNWLIVILLTVFLHLFLFLLKLDWIIPQNQSPRMAVEQVSPEKIEAIRKQWQKREKSLLLHSDKTQSDTTAPDSARYFSDKNIRVEKEQRARNTTIIPHVGPRVAPGVTGVTSEKTETTESIEKKQAKVSRQFKDLSSLGIPFNLSSQPTSSKVEEAKKQVRALMGDNRSEAESGDQYVKDESLPEGSENLLNAQESVYYSFYSRLYEAIGPLWKSQIRQIPSRLRLREGEYTTLVDVTLNQKGDLVGIHHVRGSGVKELDNAIDTSWHRIERFPNPPQGLLNENGEVHTGWTFTVQVGPGNGLQYFPPERNY